MILCTKTLRIIRYRTADRIFIRVKRFFEISHQQIKICQIHITARIVLVILVEKVSTTWLPNNDIFSTIL